MRDAGHEESDALLKEMQAEVEDVYRTAQKDLQKKIDDYVGKFAKDDAKKQKLVANGKMSQEDYEAWKQKAMLTGKQYRQMLNTVSADLTNADQIARSIINGYTPEAYAVGMNYGTYQVESGTTFNTNFTLYNRETVERLLRDDPQLLPMPKVNIPKDKAWNYKQVNRQLTQGILQGESMPKIAKRFEAVTPSKTVADIKDAYKKTSEQIAKEIAHKNKVAAIRNARTAVTGAENAGRMDSFYRAKEMGIGVKKQWLATPDGRTRDSHVEIDLEVVELEENFSNGCEYPGDPGGDPAEVYNCRCAMIPWLDRFGDKFDGERAMNLHGMTYDEWKESHRSVERTDEQQFVETEAHHVVNGHDITDEWHRRPEEYEFEIEDVIAAQGFDGLPRVVSPEEFDELKKESHAYGFRGYSAPDPETLALYQKELYSGKWYVDCSVGTAAYGQGMYMQGVCNSGDEIGVKLSEMIANGYGKSRKGSVYRVEEMAMSKDAKGIALYKHLGDLNTVSNYSDFSMEYMQKEIEGKWKNQGVYAAAKGYDYIYFYNDSGSQEMIVLNRTKLIIKGE